MIYHSIIYSGQPGLHSVNPQCAFVHWRDLRLIYMCHKVSPAPFSLNEHHGNRTPSEYEIHLTSIIGAISSTRGPWMVLAPIARLFAPIVSALWSATVLPPSSQKEGEMRTRVQHACVEAVFTNKIARRMPACMPPNNLAPLGPRGEQTPSWDTGENKRGANEPPLPVNIELRVRHGHRKASEQERCWFRAAAATWTEPSS
jgi:hypothetical protein